MSLSNHVVQVDHEPKIHRFGDLSYTKSSFNRQICNTWKVLELMAQVTAIELDGGPVTFVAVDTLLEFVFVEERHDLNEDCFSFIHGLRMAS